MIMTSEEIYDAEIAPELLKLCKRCQELGMSFLASVEYNASDSDRGTTEFQMPIGQISVAQLLVHWASRCSGNIDQLMLTVNRYAEKHGHSSIFLQLAGNDNVKFSGHEFAAITVASKEL
jgi:hypothetical protein